MNENMNLTDKHKLVLEQLLSGPKLASELEGFSSIRSRQRATQKLMSARLIKGKGSPRQLSLTEAGRSAMFEETTLEIDDEGQLILEPVPELEMHIDTIREFTPRTKREQNLPRVVLVVLIVEIIAYVIGRYIL